MGKLTRLLAARVAIMEGVRGDKIDPGKGIFWCSSEIQIAQFIWISCFKVRRIKVFSSMCC